MKKKLLMTLVCALLAASVLSSGLVFAADESDPGMDTAIAETGPVDEQVEEFHVWGSLAEAKAVYGLNLTYGFDGYNVIGGYFLCYYIESDGSRYYFGCYTL